MLHLCDVSRTWRAYHSGVPPSAVHSQRVIRARGRRRARVPLRAGELSQPHGPRAWSFWVRSRLGPEPELTTIGETGGRVHHDRRGVHLVDESLGLRSRVLRDDRLGVTSSISPDVRRGHCRASRRHPRRDRELLLGGPVLIGDVFEGNCSALRPGGCARPRAL